MKYVPAVLKCSFFVTDIELKLLWSFIWLETNTNKCKIYAIVPDNEIG